MEACQCQSSTSDSIRGPSQTAEQFHRSQLIICDGPRSKDEYPTMPVTQKRKRLDLVQRLERKLAEYNASENIFKRWLFEIASWLLSALCMGAIIGIYSRIHGQTMFPNETLLTLANILGKIASAALIVPTSEALGQLKWNWFHNSKAMWDFEIFDKASRGPWGATLLLFRTKGRSLAALGALLIVLLLAIDSFFQQVVVFPDQWALQKAFSEIPRAVVYRPHYQKQIFHGYEDQLFDQYMIPIIRPFLYENGTQPRTFGNGTTPEIPLSCPGSKCTWPDYESLAVCSQCVEASNLLHYDCQYTQIDWTAYQTESKKAQATPNGTVCGYFLNLNGSAPVLMSGYVVEDAANGTSFGEALLVRLFPFTDADTKTPIMGGSVNFKHLRNTLFDALIVSASNGSDSVYKHQPPVVQECALSWCVKTFSSSYEFGRYHEVVTDSLTYTNMTPGPFPWESYPVQIEDDVFPFISFGQNITIERENTIHNRSSLAISNATYSVDNTSVANIMVMFDPMFPSYYTDHGPSGRPVLRYGSADLGSFFRELDFNPWLAPNNVSRHMERLASAMTDVIRSVESKEMLRGLTFNATNFILVRWVWLTFPLLLLILSLIFLVSTIVKTSKDTTAAGVWKTSAMPTLIYGLPKETQSQFASSSTWRSHETKKTRIRLHPKIGWRVSGHNVPAVSPRLPPQANTAPRGWI